MSNTYAATKQTTLIGGVPIKGFVDDSFVRVTQVNVAVTAEEDIDGSVTFSVQKRGLFRYEFTLQDASESNDYLAALYWANQASPGAGLVPVIGKDELGRGFFTSAGGMIEKLPDIDKSNESGGSKVWALLCEVLPGAAFPGGRS